MVLADDRFKIICAAAQSNIIQRAGISKPDTDHGKSALFYLPFRTAVGRGVNIQRNIEENGVLI